MSTRRRSPAHLAALLLTLVGTACKGASERCDPTDPFCGSGSGSPVPTTVTVTPNTVNLTAIGATQQLVPSVLDQNGQAIAGAVVTWASDSAGIASVSASGLVRAESNGTARVVATSGTVTGSATVTVQDPCQPIGSMTFASVRAGTLSATDCQLADERRADFWTLTITSTTAGPVQIDLISAVSAPFDTYLGLVDGSGSVIAEDDDAHFTGSIVYDRGSHLAMSLAAGTYRIVATSYSAGETGAYQLFVGPGLLCPEQAVMALGTSTSGADLAVDDCSYDGYFADVYALYVASAATVTFTMTSAAFDAYLILMDPAGTVLTEDDDSGGGTNARISRSLTPGWYVIEASSTFAAEVGAYTLTID